MRASNWFLMGLFVAFSSFLASTGFAADHREAPGVLGRGQLDLNDLYVFQAPGNAANSVLILTVNPFAADLSPTTFGTAAAGVAYEFNIDNNGDAVADVTYATTFTGNSATQAFTVTKNGMQIAAGNAGSISSVLNGGFVTAGLFDDPFFFDLAGFRNGFAFTGANAFGAANVSAIVLEVPSTELGGTLVGIQTRTLENGIQVDRTGRPAIATALIPSGVPGLRDAFNQGSPATDLANFGSTVSTSITSLSNAANAAALTPILLPDLMTYDSSSNAGFLNGRKLTDDVIDASLGLLTAGAVTTDLANNDSNFSGIFPFLAPAQPTAVPEPASMTLLAACAAGFAGVRRLRRRSPTNVE